jgi:hypothetical protein
MGDPYGAYIWWQQSCIQQVIQLNYSDNHKSHISYCNVFFFISITIFLVANDMWQRTSTGRMRMMADGASR